MNQNVNLNRRTALKNLGIIAAGMALLPSCANKLKLIYQEEAAIAFNESQSTWIKSISEAILPTEDLKLTTYESFPDFLAKMIDFDKKASEKQAFISGYNYCTDQISDRFAVTNNEGNPEDIITYFKEVFEGSQEKTELDEKQKKQLDDQAFFCREIRRYTIAHVTTSKEYQEDILEYKLVPDPYQVCVSI